MQKIVQRMHSRLTNGKVDMKLLKEQASEVVSSSDNSAPDSLGLVRKVAWQFLWVLGVTRPILCNVGSG